MDELTADLPVGVGVHTVSDQAVVVEEAVGGFTSALFEAVVIVLIVSFISLGVRAGLVVACSIPLVLAMVFLFMEYSGITMQRISLGALIIALGLLVDDAMITVEMMVTRLEMGETKEQAATFAYTSTAFPMLTGTLVTVAGFVPIGLNASSAGEYTFTLFAVIAVAMLVSWIVAVLFAPVLGVHILSAKVKPHDAEPGRIGRAFNGGLLWAMRNRWWAIGITVALFVLSVFSMQFVQNQFFPSSDRPEILVDLNLPQNASIAETRMVVDKLEATLKDDPDIVRWSTYIGEGAIRFYLPLDQQLQNPYYAQLVIVSKGKSRPALTARLQKRLREEFVGVGSYVQALEMGPPVGRPIQYRVSGKDIDQVRKHAIALATELDKNSHIGEIIYDWNEPGKVLRIDIAQDKARQLGLSSEDVANLMNSIVVGSPVTQVDDDIYLIDVVGRAEDAERGSPETLQNLQIVTPGGTSIPLLAFATVRYELEQPLVWRRDRKPTITIKAAVRDEIQPTDLVKQLQTGHRQIRRQFAGGLQSRHRRYGGGKRQGPGADCQGRAVDAVFDGDLPDDPVAQRAEAVPGGQRRAARADRRGACADSDGHADGLRGDPRDSRVDRHHHPQLGDSGDPDRLFREERLHAVGRGGAGHGTSSPTDFADGGGGEPGDDPDCPGSVLGADGLRDDWRDHHRDFADVAVFAGAVRGLVQNPRTEE